ncbi:MAG: hypothetical protein GTO45_27030 [Candidatus Aminicenantes bacterium]|nr:hypothetical protein [Candidatus Aminicenantes bacterium]NIM82438.1 hypothetical protein [Candidatus Aminicenantes bacterium]NIN21799.1 hypothetical protein [Candidatus Aminicenantes bacterium]NIN45591.1 hypothetical protein [Candidatus Aminicenantes bacterium]NIN88422.1 hypothetical protein [Candidatus Aminicenantes bacterium]
MNPHKNDLLQDKKKEKILLALLPYWYPLMPSLGLCSIKSYLERHGYIVKVLDFNSETLFKRIYDKYFDTLLNFFPENKKLKGNDYYNVGHNVLQNHMMAHINHTNEEKYFELVKIIIYKTFYFEANDALVKVLNEILDQFYYSFEGYLIELLEKEKPDVVGISLYTHTLPTSIHALKLIRNKYSHIRTVAGGGIFSQTLDVKSPDFEYFLQKTEVYLDKIIIGEGEELLLKYLQGELPDSQRVYSKKDIGNKLFDIASNRPDFSDFDLSLYLYLPAYGSRSCPYRCKFCSEPVYWGAIMDKAMWKLIVEV